LFSQVPRIDTLVLIQLIQSHPEQYRFDGKSILRITRELEDHEQRFEFIEDLFDQLAEKDEPAVA